MNKDIHNFTLIDLTKEIGAWDGCGSGSGYGYTNVGVGNGPATGSCSTFGNGYTFNSCPGGDGYGGGDSGMHDFYNLETDYKDAGKAKRYLDFDVYDIDGLDTIIYSVRDNIARGALLKQDLTLEDCYIAKDGRYFAHGDTIEEARDNLMFKVMRRDKSRFEKMTLDDVLPLKEAIQCYRVITGACSLGVKMFCSEIKLKDEYSIREIIAITSKAYGGNTFKKFFERHINKKETK